MTELIEAVARALDAECANCGFKLKQHALDNFAQAALTAITDAGYRIVPGWQPIETAPKDGEWIIVYDANYDHSSSSYLIAYWHKPLKVWAGKPNSKGRFPLWENATHWMPLPPAPGDEK
jgi:hypothetical protein